MTQARQTLPRNSLVDTLGGFPKFIKGQLDHLLLSHLQRFRQPGDRIQRWRTDSPLKQGNVVPCEISLETQNLLGPATFSAQPGQNPAEGYIQF